MRIAWSTRVDAGGKSLSGVGKECPEASEPPVTANRERPVGRQFFPPRSRHSRAPDHLWHRQTLLPRRLAAAAALLIGLLPGLALAGEPACEQPARLEGEFNARTPGVTIEFKRSVQDAAAAAKALASKYSFRITTQFSWGGIYVWSISAETIAALRCEPDIEMIEYNAPSKPAAHK